MKKIFSVILIVLSLSLIFTFSAFAEGEAPDADTNVSAETPENVFETVYGAVMKNSDKILAALAFVGSLIIAFAYKNGLLPILRGALSKLGDSVSKLKEETEKSSLNAAENVKYAAEKLEAAESVITELKEKLEAFEKDAEARRKAEKNSESIGIIISSQVELLYEIFMSSSLPLYQKETVGEKISEMKKAIAKINGEDSAGDGNA